MKLKKLICATTCSKLKLTVVFLFSAIMIYIPLKHIQDETVLTKDFKSEFLLVKEKIFQYYDRTSWWDSLLCRDKRTNSKLGNMTDILVLDTIFQEVWPNKLHSQNVFLIETNCNTTLPSYVLCGAESAANQNPRATVYLLTVTPFLEDPLRILRNLLARLPNLVILQIDPDSILKDTPLNGFRSDKMWNSEAEFVNAHMSDIVRVALLWKAGGTYTDSDVIYVKELPSHENAIIVTDSGAAINGFFKFSSHHKFLQDLMGFMRILYDGENYISVGPYSIGEALSLHCPTNKFRPLNKTCEDIHLLNTSTLLPIPWNKAETLMAPNSNINTSELLKESFGIHTNHFVLANNLNEAEGESLYSKLTKEFCPISYLEFLK